MCILQVQVRCCDKFFEVSPNDVENAELVVEDVVSSVLLYLFGKGTVDDVAIQFSSRLHRGLQQCSISIHAQCSCQLFTLLPRTRKNMELAVERSMCALLKELFGSVNVESVTLKPASWNGESDPALSCCIAAHI
jgi:hypothetical protein